MVRQPQGENRAGGGVEARPKPESGEEPKLQCVSAAKAGTAMPLPISA
jgi:hypothetical protein